MLSVLKGTMCGRNKLQIKAGVTCGYYYFYEDITGPVPRRRFAACKRSLELRGSRILD
jgi:hypothetical protein